MNSHAEDCFPQTRWSLIAAARSADPTTSRRALSELCEAYWRPLYTFVRRSGVSTAEAEDLVQGFLLTFIERGYFANADSDKGRLRNYVLGAMKNYLRKDRRRNVAAKRGGAAIAVDWEEAEGTYQAELSTDRTPDESFDFQWAMTLLDRSENRVQEHYVKRGKEETFRALRPFLVDGDRESYQGAGQEIGLSENAVKVAVFRLRKQFRKAIVDEIADTVDSEVALRAELEELRSILAPRARGI